MGSGDTVYGIAGRPEIERITCIEIIAPQVAGLRRLRERHEYGGRSRLRPRGLAATWPPTPRVHNAFVRVFPHVVSVPGILVGSNDPIEVNRETVARRLAAPGVREHYARAGIDVEELMSSYLVDPAHYTPGFDRTTLTDFNTDLFPRDEYDLSPPVR